MDEVNDQDSLEKARLEDAEKMLKEGCDRDFITKITGFTRQKLQALKRKHSR